jgi:hypothetical protein
MTDIRWGLLSTARINRKIIPAIRESKRGRLIAAASRDPGKAQEYIQQWKIPLAFGSYQEMLSSAAGHGHHADDAASDGHSHVESTEAPDSSVHVHDDGSEHVHEAPAEVEAMDDHNDSSHEQDNR